MRILILVALVVGVAFGAGVDPRKEMDRITAKANAEALAYAIDWLKATPIEEPAVPKLSADPKESERKEHNRAKARADMLRPLLAIKRKLDAGVALSEEERSRVGALVRNPDLLEAAGIQVRDSVAKFRD
jgi:hypothetical protein